MRALIFGLPVTVALAVAGVGCTASSSTPSIAAVPPGAQATTATPTTAATEHAHAAAEHAAPAAAAAAAAAYACPMHPDVTSATPAKCPKCGMDLVSTAPAAPPTVRITTTPAKPKAGEKARLIFEMTDGGKRLSSFDVVHEKKLHLLMVTPDLAWFAHEHPELQPDGSFALDFTFPRGGNVRLFNDFKATGLAPAVVPVDVAVDGPATPAQPLAATDLAKPRGVGAYAVRLTTAPPASGAAGTLKFLVAKGGKPVKDLEPYLGALGHLVIINEDGKTFLHSHPEDHAAPHDDTGKPAHAHPSTGEVAFATHFPKPGLYKAWAQFLHKGENIVADFVLDVKPGVAGTAAMAPASGHDHGAHQH